MLRPPRFTPVAAITSLCLLMASAPAMAQQVDEDLRSAPIPRLPRMLQERAPLTGTPGSGPAGSGAVARSGLLETDVPLGGSNEPAIAVDPNDPLHVAYASLWELRVSTDGGATWQPPVRASFPDDNFIGGDSSVAFDSQGRLFWTYLGYTWNLAIYNATQYDLYIAQCDPSTGGILSGYPVNVTQAIGLPQDADKEWLAIDSSPTSPFTDRLYVAWIDFQGGNSGTHVRASYSADQGMTWSSPAIELGTDPALNFVWPAHNAVAPNGDVYVAFHSQPVFNPAPDGTSGQVLVSRSTDGGVTYQPPTLAYQPGEADITFNRQTRAGTVPGTRFWTQGSTQPWILPDPTTPGRIYVVACDDPDNQHGVGDDANVYIVTSTDHGSTWSTPVRIDDGPGSTFQLMPTAAIDPVTGAIAVHYVDNRNGALNQNGNFLLDVFATYSPDGGLTFTPSVQINDLPFDPEPAGPCRYDCGQNLMRVSGSSASDVFAVGSAGRIVHYDGLSWSLQASSTNQNLFAVWGSGPNDFFAVGWAGVIRHYNGSFWAIEASGTSQRLYGVWGTGPNDVFAVGQLGTILHSDGVSWSPQASGTSEVLTDVWGNAPNDVFAVGDNGTILHYDGTWSPQASGTTEILWDVWGSSEDDVFAVGWNGGIVHYDGNSWSLDTSHYGRIFTGLWGSSGTDVFAIDYLGAILHYDGVVWSEMVPIRSALNGLWGSSGSDVFASGPSGAMLHYDGVAWAPQATPAMAVNPTLRIGEYNGVAIIDDGDPLHADLLAVWCGNNAPHGIPIAQQTIFDRFRMTRVGIDLANDLTSPPGLFLHQNRPNPLRTQTSIQVELPAAAHVTLSIYDVEGRLVRHLLDGQLDADVHSIAWDGRDDRGQALAPGIYWYQLGVGDQRETKRMVMVR